eukprot:916530-Amorphochlora_amoeboformis.AAC.1
MTSYEGKAPPLALRPKLVVFDLDNCMWTPELYEVRFLEGTDSRKGQKYGRKKRGPETHPHQYIFIHIYVYLYNAPTPDVDIELFE